MKSDTLLILLALSGHPMHGYAIIRDVETRTDGEVVLQTGALYRTLRRLLLDRLIEEAPRPRDEPVDDERRRYYRLTSTGERAMATEVDRLAKLVRAARLTASGKRPRLA